jgi:hypothetical protein
LKYVVMFQIEDKPNIVLLVAGLHKDVQTMIAEVDLANVNFKKFQTKFFQ